MTNNYLLTTDMAQQLYYQAVKDLPIIDYHNHLSVADLAENRSFDDVTEIWLKPDPYKHRAMRICGVPEELITGSASNKEKFNTWCKTFPRLLGNPLYDWSRMEVEGVFGVNIPINSDNSEKLWDAINERLAEPQFRAMELMNSFNVEYAAPCVSMTDDISVFAKYKELAPSLRGDDWACPTLDTITKLAELTGKDIYDSKTLRDAIGARLDDLTAVGCRFSDHALNDGFIYVADDGNFEARLKKILGGEVLSENEKNAVSSDLLRLFGGEYAKRGWVMQLHIGAKRDTSTRLKRIAGPAGGYAGIGNSVSISSLTSLLNDLEQGEYGLPRTILFTLNPIDNAAISILSGSFVGVTQGPAWWWCDHLQGMREMLENFNVFSVLSTFVGMTTDSRSLLSLVRHDYFRRMLCGWIGEKATRGELPNDYSQLSALAKAMCYQNAKDLII